MVSDLADNPGAGQQLEGLMFGGAPAPISLTTRAKEAFPKASMYVTPMG